MNIALMWPAGLTLLLGYGALTDIRQRRLANWLALLLFAFGLSYAFSIGGLTALGWHAAHGLVALLVGMALFSIGAFGGGDAKFYAGAAAYFALDDGLNLLLWVSIMGIVTILGWLVIKRLPQFSGSRREGIFAKFPYGVAIAAGGIAAAWMPHFASAPTPG
ncbi:A24 family peptidase [Altererythrobacter sp.]|uniref:A24 family peptidase n=1 Tax=Altererythrobacter sp. TaxID=1872480 RepID=UPI003D0EF594